MVDGAQITISEFHWLSASCAASVLLSGLCAACVVGCVSSRADVRVAVRLCKILIRNYLQLIPSSYMEGKTPKSSSASCKVQILDEFIEHAAKIETDIKELERTYANPCTFFGTSRRHKSANDILTNEIKVFKETQDEVLKLTEDLRRIEEENTSMLSEIEQFSMEMNDLKINLEEKGFSFTSEHNDSGNTVQVNSWKNTDEEAYVMMEDNGNIEINRTQPTECVEKYLEDNNLELDDLVTPYIQRKSYLLSRRSD